MKSILKSLVLTASVGIAILLITLSTFAAISWLIAIFYSFTFTEVFCYAGTVIITILSAISILIWAAVRYEELV